MKMRSGSLVASALASIYFLSIGHPLAAQEARPGKASRYVLKDLGTLGGPNSDVNGASVVLNRGGTLVGGADTPGWDSVCGCNVSHAFRWHEGILTDLGTLPDGDNFSFGIAITTGGTIAGISANGLIDPVSGAEAFVATLWKNGRISELPGLGGGFNLPDSITDYGVAVGGAQNTILDPFNFGDLLELPSGTQWHATRWVGGTVHDLGVLGAGTDSFALNINERGQVSGISFSDTVVNPVTGFPTLAPFFWENGRMTDLGNFGGAFGLADWLNNRGQVVGTSDLPGDLVAHAFLWERGNLHDLGTLGGSYSEAFSINDDGDVVGAALTAGDVTRDAFLWRRGVMTSLGHLPGDLCSNAESINAQGQIVGESFCGPIDEGRAVIYEHGGAVDLNTLIEPGSGLVLHEAKWINDRGEITGSAYLPNGDRHAFLLIPRHADVTSVEVEAEPLATTRSATGPTPGPLSSGRLAELRGRPRVARAFGLKKPN